MNNHTQGPWHIGKGNGEGSIFEAEDAANACLIAASPELLEALRNEQLYFSIFEDAMTMMDCSPDLEPTSAFKQACSLHGIEYGEPMGRFVNWANQQLANEV
jgi:hypothetical protein